jgi:CheY-like chemotaxis protein
MDERTRGQIFEPFFTTKGVGKGTGLGLSTVFGIVKQSGGDIRVYSEIGHGTIFKIYLPCVDRAVEKPRWVNDAGDDLTGSETVLLVEDEDVVRNLVKEILTSNGYKVLESRNGPEALAICSNFADPIHLLLTDMIMPGMSGPELKGKIAAMRPGISVLFMSGYTDDSIIRNGVLDLDTSFIEKPFTPDGLSRKVRDVLDARQAD